MDMKTQEIPVQFLPGSSLPRYVERLDDVEWVTDRRAPEPTVVRTLALASIVVGLMIILVGLILSTADAKPPADTFPTGPLPTPVASPHLR